MNGTYTSPNLPPETSGLGEYSDKDLLAELVNRGINHTAIADDTKGEIRSELIKLYQRTIDYDDPDRQYIGFLADKSIDIIKRGVIKGE